MKLSDVFIIRLIYGMTLSEYSGEEAAKSGRQPSGGQLLMTTPWPEASSVEELAEGGGDSSGISTGEILLSTVMASEQRDGHETKRRPNLPEDKLGKCCRLTASKLLRKLTRSALLAA